MKTHVSKSFGSEEFIKSVTPPYGKVIHVDSIL